MLEYELKEYLKHSVKILDKVEGEEYNIVDEIIKIKRELNEREINILLTLYKNGYIELTNNTYQDEETYNYSITLKGYRFISEV